MLRLRKGQLGIAALAVTLLVASAITAFALNMDQSRTFPARVSSTQQTNYYRVLVNFNDANISTAQKFGAIPSGSFITDVQVEVVTAFNAGTTNVLTIGTTTAANEIIASGDFVTTATGVTRVNRGAGRGLTASGDTTLYAKYTQSGTAGTTGQAVITVSYIPNNDL